jgi:hypothetical protein
MKLWCTGLLLAGAMSLPVETTAQDAAAATPPQPRRGGAALQVDWGAGGDSFYDLTGTKMDAGDGLGVSIGGFYRPMEHSPLEIYGFVGYRLGFLVPVMGGGYSSNTERVVLSLLANYRFDNKWYVAGGLVHHSNAKFEDDDPAGLDFDLGSATGATVEAGYSFIGVYYTYMNYSAGQYGDFDASSVGVRFTLRFRKWRPIM